MAKTKTKRYYWLKLKENFFEDDTIQFIEEQENGKDYVIFYLKLCLKSLTKQGMLFRLVGNKVIPYDVKSLAKLTNTNVDTVNTAMQLFRELGIIEVLDGGELYIAQMKELIGAETDKAQLMREKRARDKQLENNNGNGVTKKLPHIEKETYEDRYKDLYKNEDEDKEKQNKPKEKKKRLSTIIKELNYSEPLTKALLDFEEFRKQTKPALTERALTLLLNELDKLANSEQEKIDILNQSIMNGWKGVFPLRNQPSQSKPFKNTSDYQGEITEEELKQYDL